MFAKGAARAGLALSDADLERKFLENLSTRVNLVAAHTALGNLWHLEDCRHIADLTDPLHGDG